MRAVALLLPVAAGLAAGIAVGRALPSHPGVAANLARWVAVLVVCFVVAALVERAAARLLPLAWLLRASLAFPGHPPSRIRVAARRGSTDRLISRLREARVDAEARDSAEAVTRVLILATALQTHDRATRGHAERVRMYADLLSAELGWAEEDRDRLRWVALLHDIGKLWVEPSVLNKPGALDEEEWRVIRSHPQTGADACAPLLGWLGEHAAGIREHHERWDGTGYPAGIAGQDISLAARLIGVVDAFEVMTGPRPYHERMTVPAAKEQLVEGAGAQFDPAMVRAFLRLDTRRLAVIAGPLSAVGTLALLRPLQGLNPGLAAGAATTAALGVGAAVGLAPVATSPPQRGVVAVDTGTASAGSDDDAFVGAEATAATGIQGSGPASSPPRGGTDVADAAGASATGASATAGRAIPRATAGASGAAGPSPGATGTSDTVEDPDVTPEPGAGGTAPGESTPAPTSPPPDPAPGPGAPPVPPEPPPAQPTPPASTPAPPRPAPPPAPPPPPAAPPPATPPPATATPPPSPGPTGAPPATEGDVYTVPTGGTAVLDVLGNDADADADVDPSTLTILEQPQHGEVSVNPDGTVTYDAQPGFAGEDQFIYEVCDAEGQCGKAIVDLRIVRDRNDA